MTISPSVKVVQWLPDYPVASERSYAGMWYVCWRGQYLHPDGSWRTATKGHLDGLEGWYTSEAEVRALLMNNPNRAPWQEQP